MLRGHTSLSHWSLSLAFVIVHQLSRTDARQIAVRAQLLDANRPTDLLDTVRHLTLLQDDRTAAVAPNAPLPSQPNGCQM